MILWIILTLVVAVVVAVLTVPLVRRYDARPTGRGRGAAVLVDQLADIDRAGSGGDGQRRRGGRAARRDQAAAARRNRRRAAGAAARIGRARQIAVAVAVLVTLGGTLALFAAGDARNARAPAPAAGVPRGRDRGGRRRRRGHAAHREPRSQAQGQSGRPRGVADARLVALFARAVRRARRTRTAMPRRCRRTAATSSRRLARR